MRRFLLLIPFAAIIIVLLLWSQRAHGPATASGFVEAHDIRLGSRVGGRVRNVLAEEGRTVGAGDVLVELDPYDWTERLAEARALLASARARHARLAAGFRAEEVAQARALRDRQQAVMDRLNAGTRATELQIARDKLALSEADLRKAEWDFQRVKTLHERSEATADEFSEKTRQLAVAEARAAQSRDELKLAEEGPRAEDKAEAAAMLANAEQALAMHVAGARTEDIAEALANVDAAQSRVDAIERQMQELQIRAPSAGVIESISLRPGDLIPAGAPVMTLVDHSTLWVRAYVPERHGLHVGDKLQVSVPAASAERLTGRVTFVAREAEFMPANVQTPEERSKQVFRIKVELEPGLSALRPGMTADVHLERMP